MDELFGKENNKLPALSLKVKRKQKANDLLKICLKKGNELTIKILKENLSDKASWLNQYLILPK